MGRGGGSPFGNRYPIMYGQSQHGMGSAGDGGGGRMDRGTSCAISNTAAWLCLFFAIAGMFRRAALQTDINGSCSRHAQFSGDRGGRPFGQTDTAAAHDQRLASGEVVAVDSEKLSDSNREHREK